MRRIIVALLLICAAQAHKLLFSPFMADSESQPPQLADRNEDQAPESQVIKRKSFNLGRVGLAMAGEFLHGVSSTAEFLHSSLERMAPSLQVTKEVEIKAPARSKGNRTPIDKVKSPVVEEAQVGRAPAFVPSRTKAPAEDADVVRKPTTRTKAPAPVEEDVVHFEEVEIAKTHAVESKLRAPVEEVEMVKAPSFKAEESFARGRKRLP